MFSSSSTQLQNGALYTEDEAKEIAKSIFYHYDRNRNGVLDDYEISSMMINNYKSMNKQFSPNTNDLSLYKEVLDTDNDQQVSLHDFEQLCIRYFAGGTSQKQVHFQSSNSNSKQAQNVAIGNSNKQPLQQSITIKQNQKRFSDTKQGGKKLTQKAQEKLETSRKLFREIDIDKSGTLTESEVKQLLIKTYKQMGMTYTPSENDIKSWMAMTDQNSDGLISLSEFEALILKSLEYAGVQIYE